MPTAEPIVDIDPAAKQSNTIKTSNRAAVYVNIATEPCTDNQDMQSLPIYIRIERCKKTRTTHPARGMLKATFPMSVASGERPA